MDIATLMADFTPDESYAGYSDGDAKVLAIDISAAGDALVSAYAVAQPGITNITPALNPITQDRNYLRDGMQTHKTGQQRSFKVVGDRKHGDAFQDFVCAFARKFGRGASARAKYVYFDTLTGIGESGSVTIIVNNDGSGEAGNTSQIDVDLKGVGTPDEYTYTAPALGALTISSVAGTTSGTSLITVTGQGDGALAYRQNATVLTPAYGDAATGYTLFASGTDLTLTTGQKINVAELDALGRIIRFGSATITSKA